MTGPSKKSDLKRLIPILEHLHTVAGNYWLEAN